MSEHDDEDGHDGLDLGLDDEDHGHAPGRRRARKRRGPWGCLVVLLIVGLLVAGVAFAGVKGIDWVRDQFSSDTEDYPGPGEGEVVIEVGQGHGTNQIARTLKEADVIASVTAFRTVANTRPDEASRIQPGFYTMRKQMKAADAFDLLVDPANAGGSRVVIPEGLRVNQTVTRLADATGIDEAEFEAVLADPVELDLPASAEGNAEGYLFPSAYTFGPEDQAVDLLRAMVDRWKQVSAQVPVADAAQVGLDEHDFMTIASIIEKEVKRDEDRPAVAEVIFNRLDGTCVSKGVPQGLLQMDSTIHFLTGGGTGSVYTSREARQSDSPYNTYGVRGLPPGPIASPGKSAMEAVLEPTNEGYCYFVTVDLDTGETLFEVNEEDHNVNRRTLNTWCSENPGRCG
ncbi:endolytic transglycosylase MltG [Nocardioides sp. AE5]|uniref:endolytic transglycosylase MltG n=1 Tax=Nocardioides sp. AE5 TaxID=2962573 RepID=UPI0028817061|nr:endolytic transglycosylase MltG [Nocardioides sp. AE5]MDT0201477.1 endolytic transglycosylase MltG [Nocardioides sp. AE5]